MILCKELMFVWNDRISLAEELSSIWLYFKILSVTETKSRKIHS